MEKSSNSVLADNLNRVQLSIADACAACGRSPDAVTLLGVTKTVPPERINEAIRLGLDEIGENRVQEYLGKREALELEALRAVHLIGHLQTNKVEKIVGQVDMIQSVDSLRLASAIDAASGKRGLVTDILVEVNIGGEEAKSGVSPDELYDFLAEIAPLSSIRVRGLMTVPPISDTEVEKRRNFAKLYKLFIDIPGKNRDNRDIGILSMGMSDDYREAILEGATMVRVGSAIFGKRNYTN